MIAKLELSDARSHNFDITRVINFLNGINVVPFMLAVTDHVNRKYLTIWCSDRINVLEAAIIQVDARLLSALKRAQQ